MTDGRVQIYDRVKALFLDFVLEIEVFFLGNFMARIAKHHILIDDCV